MLSDGVKYLTYSICIYLQQHPSFILVTCLVHVTQLGVKCFAQKHLSNRSLRRWDYCIFSTHLKQNPIVFIFYMLPIEYFVSIFLYSKVRTIFPIRDCDQRLLLLPNRSSIRGLALGSSQDEAELLVVFMDGVVHQADHTRLL